MTTEKIGSKIERFIRTGEGHFDALALELFAYQFAHNLPYQSFCKAQNVTPDTVKSWQDIPVVPIAAFKSVDLATFPVARAAAVFHSSGTTGSTPSKHFLKSLTYYETSLMKSFEKWAIKGSAPYFVLAPSAGEASRSSLSWMLDVIRRKCGGPESATFVQRGVVQQGELYRALEKAQGSAQPVMLLGTTLALLSFFDQCAKDKKTFLCASGSRVMDTGGMKTQNREVSRDEFLRLAWTYLGIPEAECINEYGMCEMSSQFYTRGASVVFEGPAWTRTHVVEGALQHYDLANVDSVMAIRTEDQGELAPGGFILKGRLPAADVKGCSLEMETYLKRP